MDEQSSTPKRKRTRNGHLAIASASSRSSTGLLAFTLVEKVTWLKPVAGVVLVGIGVQLVWSFFKH
jgi:hypothetical protein